MPDCRLSAFALPAGLALVLAATAGLAPAAPDIQPLHTAVIKATTGLCHKGYGILVPAGTPIYVHLDVRNQSLIDLKVDQDARLYYVPIE